MKRYIITYRGEWSTVIEANSPEEAIQEACNHPNAHQWECISLLHPSFFEDQTDEIELEFKDI